MQKLRKTKPCSYCGDTIRKDGRVKIRENGKVRFILDIGCVLFFEKLNALKIKGKMYKIV